jgi:hypothetical protein
MRAFEFLTEKEETSPNIASLKTQIISQVKKSQDPDLLEKLYTALNKGGLVDRIAPILTRDTDTKGYVDKLVEIIIGVPGTYEEKQSFINQYPTGYIDVDKMISGEYVKFTDLITGSEGAPLQFVHRVFDSLKQVTFGGAKGPGEFGLAVLSPYIKITGKGDLHIRDLVIEVKANAGASGGRVGTPGLLSSDNIPAILEEAMPTYKVPQGESLNLNQLPKLMDMNGLDKQQKTALATKLFSYIFKNKADISGLVTAAVNGGDLNPQFLKANYEIYQAESEFSGMMLMNFKTQACRYFTDPLQMASEIYAFSIYLISANSGFQARQILSQVTLRPVKETTSAPKVIKTEKPAAKAPAEPVKPATDELPAMKKNAGIKSSTPAGVAPSRNTTSMQGTSMASNPKPEPEF